MNVAFFGASSQIAKGLIKKFSRSKTNKLYFFVRNKESFAIWLVEKKLSLCTGSQFKNGDWLGFLLVVPTKKTN